jgi:hypothetical protein
MFNTSGTLTPAAPGGFGTVVGSLSQSPDGASIQGGVPASADPLVWGQPSDYRSFGTLSQTSGQTKVVIGCWFYFKQIGASGTLRSAIMFVGIDPLNPGPELLVSENTLKAMSIYNESTLQVLPFIPSNEWLYLSIAAVLAPASTYWSARFFYKRPKGNLTQWASWNAVDCYVGGEGFAIALYGMAQQNQYDHANVPSFEGRISACTVHSFENADFSDVVYPSEILEPGYQPPAPDSGGMGIEGGAYNLLYAIAQNTAGTPPAVGDGIYALAFKVARNTAGVSPVVGDSLYDLFYKIAGNTAGTPPRLGDRLYNLLFKIANNTGPNGPKVGDGRYNLLAKICENTE